MRVLFALPYVPSPIRVRPYHFIRQLARRHEVSVLAVGTGADADDANRLRAVCARVEMVPLRAPASARSCARAALRGEPLQAGVCRSPALAHRLSQLLADDRFDLVHVEHLRAAHLVELIPRDVPTLFDSVDCIALLWERTLRRSHSVRQRLLALLELRRTRAFEARMLRRFDRTTATSEEDGRALETLAPGVSVSIVPNGVDLAQFRPIDGPREPATLVFSGKMSYHANVTAVLYFVRHVLPRVRQARPDVRLRIVGSGPPREVRSLARDPAITVSGRVPDMREAVGSATVAVCPVTVKVGIQNKVLEAMALGLPVVCTRAGAMGLGARPEQDLLVADDPGQFARHVERLLADSDLSDRIRWSGRRYVETHHRWDLAAGRLESIYQDLCAGTLTPVLRATLPARAAGRGVRQ